MLKFTEDSEGNMIARYNQNYDPQSGAPDIYIVKWHNSFYGETYYGVVKACGKDVFGRQLYMNTNKYNDGWQQGPCARSVAYCSGHNWRTLASAKRHARKWETGY